MQRFISLFTLGLFLAFSSATAQTQEAKKETKEVKNQQAKAPVKSEKMHHKNVKKDSKSCDGCKDKPACEDQKAPDTEKK